MAAPVSILNQLTEDQRRQLIGWLEVLPTREVRDRVALPPPEGFGIETHITTLKRYYAKHRAETRSEEADIARLLAKPGAPDPLDSATHSLAADWAFQIAANPRRNVAAFKALSRWILKQRELDQHDREIELLDKRLALDREKFEYNAARAALEHHAKLGDVLDNNQTDNEAKILQARSILFGIPIDKLPK